MLIQGSFLSSLLNLLPQKGMVKMIDCNITKNYLREQARMTKSSDVGVCRISCNHCPLSRFNNDEEMLCTELELRHPEKAIAIVQKWSDEHPQRTYLSEFLKNYPNAQLKTVLLYSPRIISPEIPKCICPYHLGLMSSDDCRKDHNCVKCWNQPIEGGEK